MRIKWTAALMAVIALMIGTVNVNSAAGAGLMEQVQKLSAGQSESRAAVPAAVPLTTPLAKLAISGRVIETLDNGACPSSPAVDACATPADCLQIQIQGPIIVPALGPGKSNFSACLTADNIGVSSVLNVCFNGLGKGTLTSANGKNSVNFAMGGFLCVADEFPLPTPTSVAFVLNATYSVRGGSGSFTNGVGSGNLSLSALVSPVPAAPPYSATGQVNLVGSLARQ